MYGFEAFGIQDDKAARSFARGRGGETGLGEGHVKDTALTGGHGREGEGTPGSTHLFDGHLCHQIQFAIACGLETVGVEVDLIVLFGFEAQDLGGDVFDGEEEFAVSGEQERGVGPKEFDFDFGGCFGGDRLNLTGGFAGLHLAIVGKDLRL